VPKKTFFNLPEDKRQRIIDAAMDEFGSYPFREASIAGIITRAGIPRGSFYQYFMDIKDLYLYILEISADCKIKYINEAVAQEKDTGFFRRMRVLYVGGIKFAGDNPRLAAMGMFLMKDDAQFRQEIIGSMAYKANDFFEEFFHQGIARGEIKPEIDIVMISYMIYAINIAIAEYYLTQHPHGNMLDDADTYLELVDKMLDILEHGMGCQGPQV
jgi:AcrR family transcriptional regulator